MLHNVLLGATLWHATARPQLIQAVELQLEIVGLRFEFQIRNMQYLPTILASLWCHSHTMSPVVNLWNNAT